MLNVLGMIIDMLYKMYIIWIWFRGCAREVHKVDVLFKSDNRLNQFLGGWSQPMRFKRFTNKTFSLHYLIMINHIDVNTRSTVIHGLPSTIPKRELTKLTCRGTVRHNMYRIFRFCNKRRKNNVWPFCRMQSIIKYKPHGRYFQNVPLHTHVELGEVHANVHYVTTRFLVHMS